MDYVEELIPKEPIHIPQESLLVTMPENWQPPSKFFVEDTKPATAAHHDTNTMEEKIEEVHICIVEEEFSKEFLHMASQDAPLLQGYDLSSVAAKDEDPGKEEGAQGQHTTKECKYGAQDRVKAATGEAVEVLGGTMMEGGEVFAPPPISIVPEPWCAPPPFFPTLLPPRTIGISV